MLKSASQADAYLRPGQTLSWSFFPVGIYIFKINNRKTRARCEICLKLAIKIPCSGVYIVNFELKNADWVVI